MNEALQEHLLPAAFTALCGRAFHADPSYFPKTLYRGRPVYFCTEACLHAFEAEAEAFCESHHRPTDPRSS